VALYSRQCICTLTWVAPFPRYARDPPPPTACRPSTALHILDDQMGEGLIINPSKGSTTFLGKHAVRVAHDKIFRMTPHPPPCLGRGNQTRALSASLACQPVNLSSPPARVSCRCKGSFYNPINMMGIPNVSSQCQVQTSAQTIQFF
jgi:hypothetical protein